MRPSHVTAAAALVGGAGILLSSFLLARPVPAGVDDCPVVEPKGYEIEPGRAEGDEVEARNAALQNAKMALRQRFCEGRSEVCCAAVWRHIEPWGKGSYTPGTRKKPGWACAAAVLPDAFLENLPEDCDSSGKAFEKLAGEVRSRVGNRLLSIEPPRWETGCVLGELGAAVAGEIRRRMTGIRLVGQGEDSTGAVRLVSLLHQGVGGLNLVVSLADPNEKGEVVLGDVPFTADMLPVEDHEMGLCRTDAALALPGGRKVSGDFRIDVVALTRDGNLCEGETLTPTLKLSQPGRVQVWNVDKDGLAFLVWPPPGASDQVRGTVSLGEFTMVPMPEPADERFVAVAVPAGGSFGLTDGWSGYCRLNGVFDSRYYPQGSAVGTATFHVIPAGVESCPQSGKQAAPLVTDLPVCGR